MLASEAETYLLHHNTGDTTGLLVIKDNDFSCCLSQIGLRFLIVSNNLDTEEEGVFY